MFNDSLFTQPYRQFNGTRIIDKHFKQASLHNRITQEFTDYNERAKSDYHLIKCLEEFFNINYLDYLANIFKKIPHNKLPFRKMSNKKDIRLHLYLAGINCILIRYGIFIPNRTYSDIENNFHAKINITKFFTFYNLFKKYLPAFWKTYQYNNYNNFNNALKFALADINKNGYAKQIIIDVHLNTIKIFEQFIQTPNFKFLKPITFDLNARGLVSLAYTITTEERTIPYSHENPKTRKIIATKKFIIKQQLNKHREGK